MSLLEAAGQPEEPMNEACWKLIQEMQTNGYYNDVEVAREGLKRGTFPQEWREKQELRSASEYIRRISTARRIDGRQPAITLAAPHQLRLIEWADFDERITNLMEKLRQREDDSRCIKIDASDIMFNFPEKKDLVMAILPPDLRPTEK